MTSLADIALAVAVGVGSALVPVVNAEAYAGVAATRWPVGTLVAVVLALAAGQTAGKLLLFESARRGAERFSRHRTRAGGREGFAPRRRRAGRVRRWSTRSMALLDSPRTGPPVVLAAAVLGVPPLAAVSLAAGVGGQSRWLFGGLCLLGRTVRFGTLAAGLAWAWV